MRRVGVLFAAALVVALLARPAVVRAEDCAGLIAGSAAVAPPAEVLSACAPQIEALADDGKAGAIALRGHLRALGIAGKASKRDARRDFRAAAEAGDHAAKVALADLLLGRLTAGEEERLEAARLLGEAARAGVPEAVLRIEELVEDGRIERPAGFGASMSALAAAGNAEAKLRLARQELARTSAASEEALTLLRSAADIGNLEALALLGAVEVARGNTEPGRELLKNAAEAGNADARFLLGTMALAAGDVARGLDRLEAAASAGHVGALHRLGEMYARGESVPKNMARAADHWFAAVRGGDDASLIRLMDNFDRLNRADQLTLNGSYRAPETLTTEQGLLLFANWNLREVQRAIEGTEIAAPLNAYRDAMDAFQKLSRIADDQQLRRQAGERAERMAARFGDFRAHMKSQRRARELQAWLTVGAGILAILSLAPEHNAPAAGSTDFDPCRGINGIGWYGPKYANMAAIGGCRPY